MQYESEYYGVQSLPLEGYLQHHGIKGQKWGIRRFQNSDGSLTEAGKKRYNKYHTESGYRTWEGDKKVSAIESKARKLAENGNYDKAADLFVKAAKSVGETAQNEYRRFILRGLSTRRNQILAQEAANDTEETHWNRKEFQEFADSEKKTADMYDNLAKAVLKKNKNINVSEDEFDAADRKYIAEKLKEINGKRYDKPDPDVSKTKHGSDENLRAINPGDLQAKIEQTSGSLYDHTSKSARYKKVMDKFDAGGSNYSERERNYKGDYVDDLAKAALLDLGYKPTKQNIEYIRKLRVIDWD